MYSFAFSWPPQPSLWYTLYFPKCNYFSLLIIQLKKPTAAYNKYNQKSTHLANPKIPRRLVNNKKQHSTMPVVVWPFSKFFSHSFCTSFLLSFSLCVFKFPSLEECKHGNNSLDERVTLLSSQLTVHQLVSQQRATGSRCVHKMPESDDICRFLVVME